jgi:uncharacterized protein YaaN involved in tellurite resistance
MTTHISRNGIDVRAGNGIRVRKKKVSATNNVPTVTRPQSNLAPISLREMGEFGRTAASKVGTIADKLTSTARGSDMDEIGQLLGDLVVTAREYDPLNNKKTWNPLTWIPLPAWAQKKLTKVQTQFASVDSQMHTLTTQIDHRINLYNDRIGDLEALSVLNEEAYYELGDKIAEMDSRILMMKANVPVVDEDPFSSQRCADWNQAIEFGEKRVMDLRLIQQHSRQLAPQIKLTETNSVALAHKFDDIKATTIPAWKQTFSLYILQCEQKTGIELATKIDDATNEAMKRSADMLEMNTVNIHRALGRNVIDVATLEYTQQKLVAAVQSVQKVALENQQRLAHDRPKLEAMSASLGNQLAALNVPQLGTQSNNMFRIGAG